MTFADSLTLQWNKLRGRADPLLAQVRRRHAALSTQERRLLAICAAVLAGAAVFLIFIEPPLTKLARLRTELPQLRVQAAEVDDIAAQAAALSRRARVQAVLPQIEEIRASLTRAGLAADRYTLTATEGDKDNAKGYVLTVSDTSARLLFDWLEVAVQDWGVAADKAELTRASNPHGRPLPGLLNGTVHLSLPEEKGA